MDFLQINSPWHRNVDVKTFIFYSKLLHAFAGGDSQGMVASACQGRRMEAEEGLYPPEADRASLHDSEGLSLVHTRSRSG